MDSRPVYNFDDLIQTFNNQEEHQYIKRRINICLAALAKISRQCGGVMLGSIVRDYLLKDIPAKDVDIHFKSCLDVENFIAVAKTNNRIVVEEISVNTSSTLYVKLCRVSFEFYHEFCQFDVDLAAKRPNEDGTPGIDYDFDVNGITYNGLRLGYIGLEGTTEEHPALMSALSHIDQKIMIPNPQLLVPCKRNRRRRHCHLYRMSKFIDRGWYIVDYDKVVTAGNFEEPTTITTTTTTTTISNESGSVSNSSSGNKTNNLAGSSEPVSITTLSNGEQVIELTKRTV